MHGGEAAWRHVGLPNLPRGSGLHMDHLLWPGHQRRHARRRSWDQLHWSQAAWRHVGLLSFGTTLVLRGLRNSQHLLPPSTDIAFTDTKLFGCCPITNLFSNLDSLQLEFVSVAHPGGIVRRSHCCMMYCSWWQCDMRGSSGAFIYGSVARIASQVVHMQCQGHEVN